MSSNSVSLDTQPFLYEYDPGAIRFGRECVSEMAYDFEQREFGNALVITGQNVGANDQVMEPIKQSLGDKLAGVFAETSPEKSFYTAYDSLIRVKEFDIDVIIGVGAGSSLDIATVTSALAARYRPMEKVQQEVEQTGEVVVEEEPDEFLPLVFIPTTLTGADLSAGAGIKVPGHQGERPVLHPALTPSIGYYDPELFETTPKKILVGSAMNSFDKGVEALYAQSGEPITDATAIRGLRYLQESLPQLANPDTPEVMEKAVMGGILTQLGVTVPEQMKLATVHAMCHALRHQFGVQQGVAHAVVIPSALEWILSETTGTTDKLADAFDVRGHDDVEQRIIEAVTHVRDQLRMPQRLREVDGARRDGLREAAELTIEDSLIEMGPAELNPTVSDVEAVFQNAW